MMTDIDGTAIHGTPSRGGSLPHPAASRRDLLAAPLLVLLPQLLATSGAEAAPDPSKTIVVPAKDVTFEPSLGAPAGRVEEAQLFSKPSSPGLYLALIKWYPGWMSAPHHYATDRICVVLSGT